MSSFLAQIWALGASIMQPEQPQLEPRRVRRQKARDKAKNNQKLAKEKAG